MFSAATPIPVEGPITDAEIRAAPVPVNGPLTDAELRASPVPVSGIVATNGLTDSELRAAPVDVAGPLTDTELRASPVPVSVPGVVNITGIANPLPVSGPLTDTELRSSPVGVTANAGTHLNTSALALETTQSAQSTLIGAVNESAPANDTASSGLNGRLQRIAQRLTSLISLLPTSLGQKTSANSLAVVLSSDQPSIPISGTITASGTVNNIPNRPSQGTGRTHVNATISAANTDQTVYTVTAGKTFYLTTLILSAFNSSIGAVGVIILKDGGAGGTAKLSYLMQQAGVGALVATQPLVPGNNTFQEPLQFTGSVFMDITSGTVTYSVGIVGYEE